MGGFEQLLGAAHRLSYHYHERRESFIIKSSQKFGVWRTFPERAVAQPLPRIAREILAYTIVVHGRDIKAQLVINNCFSL